MAAERLSMRKIKELLRLEAEGRSEREISRSLKVSRSTVQRYRRRAEEAGLGWPLPEGLTDSEIEARLFPPPPAPDQPRPLPAWKDIDQELRRKGVTLRLLWDEYRGAHPEAYSYSRFCELFAEWKGSLDVVLRQEYKAGERTFVDYAGQTMPVVDQHTGEIRDAQVFVGALGASNYTYAEATWTQSLPDWIGGHVRMFAYYGSVSELVIPDNLRSAVNRACRYDPDKNPTYQELADLLAAQGLSISSLGRGFLHELDELRLWDGSKLYPELRQQFRVMEPCPERRTAIRSRRFRDAG